MDTTNITFLIISIAIIAFNTYVFYNGYKDLQRKRQELREYKEQMLAEIDGLLSVQFVKKVIDLVESKDYTYQVDTKQ